MDLRAAGCGNMWLVWFKIVFFLGGQSCIKLWPSSKYARICFNHIAVHIHHRSRVLLAPVASWRHPGRRESNRFYCQQPTIARRKQLLNVVVKVCPKFEVILQMISNWRNTIIDKSVWSQLLLAAISFSKGSTRVLFKTAKGIVWKKSVLASKWAAL